MGWWKLVSYPERKQGIKFINILPTRIKTQNAKDGNLYLRLWTMSHTIYGAKFKQTITHQHVLLSRGK